MSVVKTNSHLAAESLVRLWALRHTPQAIDQGQLDGSFKPHDLVMTSMDSGMGGIVSPAYPELLVQNDLGDRLAAASEAKRPLVEADIVLQPKLGVASLTLRLCHVPAIPTPTIESSWAFLAGPRLTKLTLDEIVAGILQHRDGGNTLGEIQLRSVFDNQDTGIGNPVLTKEHRAEETIVGIHQAIANELAFVPPKTPAIE